VLHTLGVRREDDGLAGTNDGRGRLEEEERLFGQFVAELGGMGGIVAADAHDFARVDRREGADIGEPPSASG
jgi:hypothetical protein